MEKKTDNDFEREYALRIFQEAINPDIRNDPFWKPKAPASLPTPKFEMSTFEVVAAVGMSVGAVCALLALIILLLPVPKDQKPEDQKSEDNKKPETLDAAAPSSDNSSE